MENVSWGLLTTIVGIVVFTATASAGFVIWLTNLGKIHSDAIVAAKHELREEISHLADRVRKSELKIARAGLNGHED